jgi:hypothetical protein
MLVPILAGLHNKLPKALQAPEIMSDPQSLRTQENQLSEATLISLVAHDL